MSHTSKRISILGAGWLGSPLAVRLQQEGHQLKVSTTTAEKIRQFTSQGIDSTLLHIGPQLDIPTLEAFLRDTDLLIITIPPGRSQQHTNGDYTTQIRSLIPYIEAAGIPELIFTSSTTVYLSLQGVVNEDTIITPISDMDRQIVDIEQSLLTHPAFKATILRLGALIGGDRHPVRYIVQRPVVTEANNPVNMVHRDDIIRLMSRMLEQPLPNEVFNVVAPIHSSRRDFYTAEAQHLSLTPLPEFTDNPAADMRRVDGSRIAQRYGVDYEWLGSGNV